MVSLTHQPFWFFMYGRRKLPRSFFFVSRVSKITPSPIPINKGGFTGGFEKDLHFVYKIWVPGYPFKWFRKNSPHLYENLQGFEGVFWRMIYNLFTKFEFKDICINGSAKKLSSPIPQNTEVCGGVEEKIYRKIFSPSPISMKRAVWHPCFGKYSPIVYRPPYLIATGKPKVHPFWKNISHLYE